MKKSYEAYGFQIGTSIKKTIQIQANSTLEAKQTINEKYPLFVIKCVYPA